MRLTFIFSDDEESRKAELAVRAVAGKHPELLVRKVPLKSPEARGMGVKTAPQILLEGTVVFTGRAPTVQQLEEEIHRRRPPISRAWRGEPTEREETFE